MSPRRKQSTKELGAILNEAVPHVVAEEVQLPADSPVPAQETAETPVEAQNAAADDEATETIREASEPPTEAQAASETADDEQESAESDAELQAGGPASGATRPLPVTDGAEPLPAQAAEADAGDAEPATGPAVAAETPDPSQRPPSTESPIPEAELRFAADVDSSDSEPMTPAAAQESGEETAAQETAAQEIAPVTWRKSTIPFREDQYDEIGRLLAEFRADQGVQLTIAEVVRLGLDKQIAAFQDEETRPALLQEIYEQQMRESQGNENLKHSRSHGLSQYLRR